MSKDKFINGQQSTFETQLQTMNTRPFSTQRDNLVLTRKKRAKEKKKKGHAIEIPQDGLKEKGGKLGRADEGQGGGQLGGSWQMQEISFT